MKLFLPKRECFRFQVYCVNRLLILVAIAILTFLNIWWIPYNYYISIPAFFIILFILLLDTITEYILILQRLKKKEANEHIQGD